MQRKALLYDKAGDQHYDFISAWIKSTRGSDPDASLYYLVAMLEGGEDPRFIARRMIVLASEDVGNADPQALELAVAAAHAVEHVGMPESQFALAQAAIYSRWRRSPTPSSARSAPPTATSREHGAVRAPGAAAVRGLPRRARPGPRGRATTTRTTTRGTSTPRNTCPRAWSTCASTRPTTPRRELRERLEHIRRERRREP